MVTNQTPDSQPLGHKHLSLSSTDFPEIPIFSSLLQSNTGTKNTDFIPVFYNRSPALVVLLQEEMGTWRQEFSEFNLGRHQLQVWFCHDSLRAAGCPPWLLYSSYNTLVQKQSGQHILGFKSSILNWILTKLD